MLEESKELNEVYRLYGLAAHNCCNMEHNLVRILLGPKWAEIENLNPEKVTAAYEDLRSKTLGRLFKMYQKHYSFSEEKIAQMQMVLDKRNHLMHHFFGSYGKKMYDKSTYPKMIEELENLVVIFQSASHSLNMDNW